MIWARQLVSPQPKLGPVSSEVVADTTNHHLHPSSNSSNSHLRAPAAAQQRYQVLGEQPNPARAEILCATELCCKLLTSCSSGKSYLGPPPTADQKCETKASTRKKKSDPKFSRQARGAGIGSIPHGIKFSVRESFALKFFASTRQFAPVSSLSAVSCEHLEHLGVQSATSHPGPGS